MERKTLNFVYVDGETSHLSEFRGRSALATFEKYWRRLANVGFTHVGVNRFVNMDIGDNNIIWLDNVRDSGVARKLQELKDSGNSDFRIVYALDDFVWEGVAGKATSLRDVGVVEMFLAMADTIVVSNPTIYQLLLVNSGLGLIDESKDVVLIPTAVNSDFYPTYREFKKRQMVNSTDIAKAKILVKGVSIPDNVQKFISTNYKNYDITVSCVGVLNDHVMGLIENQKIAHSKHWANPDINFRSAPTMFALERDGMYDFTIICKPEEMSNDLYELASGDEDVLFAIASGSVPVCGINHVGYTEDSIFYASGLTFGQTTYKRDENGAYVEDGNGNRVVEVQETSAEEISAIIKEAYKYTNYNEALRKSVHSISERVMGTPVTLRNYYTALVGSEVADEERKKAKEEYDKMQAANELPPEAPVEEKVDNSGVDAPDNAIAVDFGKKGDA